MAAGVIRKRYADTGRGQVHYAQCEPKGTAANPSVLLLHQTPRSWD
jgi:hypothetical protein